MKSGPYKAGSPSGRTSQLLSERKLLVTSPHFLGVELSIAKNVGQIEIIRNVYGGG